MCLRTWNQVYGTKACEFQLMQHRFKLLSLCIECTRYATRNALFDQLDSLNFGQLDDGLGLAIVSSYSHKLCKHELLIN